MDPDSRDSPPAVELYVRSLAPRTARDRLERVVGRLTEFDREGTIESLSVRVTGKAIPATPAACVTGYGTFLCNRVAVFEEWATRSGRSLAGRFERRSVHSQFTGEDYEAIVWPELALAEYVDGDLRFVTPCVGEEPVTVEDRLESLAGATPTDPADRLERAPADPPEPVAPLEHFERPADVEQPEDLEPPRQ